VPEEWNTAIVLPLFKRGDSANCDNYWGIRLLCTVYKIYANMITTKTARIINT
jgi:hypothetical protein